MWHYFERWGLYLSSYKKMIPARINAIAEMIDCETMLLMVLIVHWCSRSMEVWMEIYSKTKVKRWFPRIKFLISMFLTINNSIIIHILYGTTIGAAYTTLLEEYQKFKSSENKVKYSNVTPSKLSKFIFIVYYITVCLSQNHDIFLTCI